MFGFVGYAAMIVGIAGAALFYTGIGASIPGFEKIPLNGAGYIVIVVVGAILAMFNRQTSD